MCLCEDLWWRFDVSVILYYEDIKRLAVVAHLVEHQIRNLGVGGSSPLDGTTSFPPRSSSIVF